MRRQRAGVYGVKELDHSGSRLLFVSHRGRRATCCARSSASTFEEGVRPVPMPEPAGLTVTTFAQRPDLLDKVFAPEIQSAVPEFMRHDPVGALYYGTGQLDLYREFGLVAVEAAEPDRPVARAFSVPFTFRDGSKGREELPDGGWDAVIRWADEDRRAGRPAKAVSALEIMVAPRLQRRGTSRLMLAALRDNAKRLGFTDLYGPLRPTDKHREPLTPFADYVDRQRGDGLPHDSWVRTHVRAGARIVKGAAQH